MKIRDYKIVETIKEIKGRKVKEQKKVLQEDISEVSPRRAKQSCLQGMAILVDDKGKEIKDYDWSNVKTKERGQQEGMADLFGYIADLEARVAKLEKKG